MSKRRAFGSIRKLPGGTYQARYNGPDHVRYTRGETFNNAKDAGKWLDQMKATISLDTWKPPTDRADLDIFGPYAANWVAQRSLAPRSRVLYEQLLRDPSYPASRACGSSTSSRTLCATGTQSTRRRRPPAHTHTAF